MSIKLFALACLCLVTFAVVDLHACSCASVGPPCAAANQASAIFVGTAVSSRNVKTDSENDFASREVKFAVEETFRGVRTNEVLIFTGWGGGDCGFGFQPGRQYLVYAFENPNTKRLSTNICSRTRPLSEANEDLAYLRNASNATSGSSILGTVERHQRDAEGNGSTEPMANVKITIESADKSSTVLTDSKGDFVVKGLKPGTYKVLIDLPKGQTTGNNQQTVTLNDKACAAVYFGVESDGRLSGVVKNQLGVPLEKAEISIFPENKKRYQGHYDFAYSDKNGVYSFKRIPKGRYKLQVRFDGLTGQIRPFPNFYHPGVSDVFQASVIEIGDGEELQGFDVIVPELPKERTIEGVVVASDGSFIKDATVTYGVDAVVYGVSFPSPGHFTFKLYEGVSVALNAHIKREGKVVQSQWITVPETGDPGKLRLIIPTH